MALSKEQVEKAKEILKDIGGLEDTFYCDYNRDYPRKTGIIMVEDKRWDGGYESVFLNIRGMTIEQYNLWQQLKTEITNNSMIRQLGDNITRIGWV